MTTPDAPHPPSDDESQGTSDSPPPPPTGGDPGAGAPPPPPTGGDPGAGAPPPPAGGGPGAGAPPRPEARMLDRRSANKVVAGVAGGLGDYFNVDPAIFRLGFIVLSVFGGSGFMLYLVGWLFLPDRDTRHSIGEGLVRRLGGGRSAGGLVLLIVALLIIADAIGGGSGLVWAAVLIGVGVLLYRQAEAGDDDPPPTGPGGQPVSSMWAEAPQAPPQQPPRAGSGGVATAPLRTDTVATDPFLPPPPPVSDDGWRPTPYTPGELPTPPSILGRITVAAALIMIGATALLDTLTGIDVAVSSYAALALTVVGAGLLVGARWGRARGLIALGVVAIIALAASSAVAELPHNAIDGGIGEQRHRPETVADLRDAYQLGIGQLTLDLSALELDPGQDVEVDAGVMLGSLEVIVPDDVGIEARASAEAAEVNLLDQSRDGTDVDLTASDPGAEGSATITLDLSVGLGEIELDRASDTAIPAGDTGERERERDRAPAPEAPAEVN